MPRPRLRSFISQGPQAQAAFIGVCARVLAQVGGLGTLILSARLMTPADIGLYMIISTSALFGSRLAESGWSELMCGRLDGKRDEMDAAFWCALACSLVPTSVGLLAAWGIVALELMETTFDQALVVLVALIPLCAAASVQSGRLLATGRVRAFAVTQLVAEGLGLAMTLVGLLLGYTVAALVAGRVLTVVVAIALLPLLTKWLPMLRLGLTHWRSHIGFVAGPAGARVGGFFQGYGIDYIVFGFLGSAELAVYRIANRIAGAINELSQEPLRQHGWATLPALLRDPDPEQLSSRVRALAVNALGLMLPVYCVLILAAPDFMPILMPGQEWSGVALVLILRTLAQMFGPFNAVAEVVVVTRAPAALTAGLAWLGAMVSVGCALAASWMAPTAYTFALGQLIGTVLCFAANMYVLSRFHPVQWRLAWVDLAHWIVPVALIAALSWQLRQSFDGLSAPVALVTSTVPFLFLVFIVLWRRYARLFQRDGFFTLHSEQQRKLA